jgi:hypothetical protein
MVWLGLSFTTTTTTTTPGLRGKRLSFSFTPPRSLSHPRISDNLPPRLIFFSLIALFSDPSGHPSQVCAPSPGSLPQELILQELQRSLLPSYAVRVPLQHLAVATTACRSALVSWALQAPLRAMLTADGVAAHYRWVATFLGRTFRIRYM